MINDQAESGNRGTKLIDATVCRYLTDEGKLTEEFRNELRITGARECKEMEKRIENVTLPGPDFFGIKRKSCKVCGDGEGSCPGYSGSRLIFGSSSQATNEFPTFCRMCRCPAHFHEVESE